MEMGVYPFSFLLSMTTSNLMNDRDESANRQITDNKNTGAQESELQHENEYPLIVTTIVIVRSFKFCQGEWKLRPYGARTLFDELTYLEHDDDEGSVDLDCRLSLDDNNAYHLLVESRRVQAPAETFDDRCSVRNA